MAEVTKIAVVGAGIMGHGIAQVAAQGGYEVKLTDVDASVLEKGLEQIRRNLDGGVKKGKVSEEDRDKVLELVSGSSDFSEAASDADLVIEAVPEKLPLKIEIFSKLSRVTREDTVLATNTSSLSIGKIAAASKNPERILGMHFFNPPHIMTLLELVHTPRTSQEALATAREVAKKMKREVVEVKDSPGFVTSRLGVVLWLESIRIFEEGIATAEDIDKAMLLGFRHPMGPLRLADMVGLDTALNIAEFMYSETQQEHFKPPRTLREMVHEKKLGQKTGEGFYKWEK